MGNEGKKERGYVWDREAAWVEKPIAEFGPVAIRQPPEVIEGMTDWCKETFSKNGLIERIKASDKGERETEKMVLDFLREHTPPGECLLAGSSVHQDQVFLRKYMPELCTHLHPYRIIDVTTVKELAKRWYEHTEGWKKLPPKKEIHLALDDIRESINILKYCREHFFAK
ncbi:hypothetical protein niasHS_013527 [Heterodera schachtii]|uniref:Exonuclease domain-containing protein n=1 Tax=Heterodera schachtii TaxID=97005 RepID=A0ABD2IFH7_HETSC